jgi:hypothetical protein
MQRFIDSKIALLIWAFVLVLSAGSAHADFTFGKPVIFGPVTSYESIDCVSYDGLEMYFESDRPGGSGDYDLWVLRRDSIDEDWGPPENLGPAVNSPQGDYDSSISADGLALYFSSWRGGSSDSGYKIYVTTRATKSDPWGQAVNVGATINLSGYTAHSPWISPDGLELYFASDRSDGYGSYDIWVARRLTQSDPWGNPLNLGPAVNSAFVEVYLSLSPDGLLLLFNDGFAEGRQRPGGYGDTDIWMSRRASISDLWQEAANVGPKINGAGTDAMPRISPDGRTLYFWTGPSASGIYATWQAPILPTVDLNNDRVVDSADMLIMVENWGTDDPLCDIGPMPWGDGIVNVHDLVVLAEHLFEEVFPPELIAYWKLDETEGDIAQNSTSDNHGTLSGNPAWQPDSGKVGGALQLDGIDDYIETDFVLNPADGPFSVFAWIKGWAPGQVIVSQTDGIGFGSAWLGIAPSDGTLISKLMYLDLASENVVTDGQWHHIGLVWNGSRRSLYADGQKVASDATDLGGIFATGGLYIGSGKDMEPGTYWSGLIDDVRIYDVALSAEQIAALAQ